VTAGDTLAAVIGAYAAGLDAEMELLRQLASLSAAQRSISGTAEPDALARFSDERTRLLNAVVTLEHELKPLRHELAASAGRAARLPGFQAVVARHREAARLVNEIIAADQQTLAALRDAEAARRFAAQAIEAGETTLAAYRRVVAPPPSTAAIFDERG
jgi:hypothetical protein